VLTHPGPVTGENFTATVVVSDDQLRAGIFGYTKIFDIKEDEPLLLQIETTLSTWILWLVLEHARTTLG
jgi:hypothetical protein